MVHTRYEQSRLSVDKAATPRAVKARASSQQSCCTRCCSAAGRQGGVCRITPGTAWRLAVTGPAIGIKTDAGSLRQSVAASLMFSTPSERISQAWRRLGRAVHACPWDACQRAALASAALRSAPSRAPAAARLCLRRLAPRAAGSGSNAGGHWTAAVSQHATLTPPWLMRTCPACNTLHTSDNPICPQLEIVARNPGMPACLACDVDSS